MALYFNGNNVSFSSPHVSITDKHYTVSFWCTHRLTTQADQTNIGLSYGNYLAIPINRTEELSIDEIMIRGNQQIQFFHGGIDYLTFENNTLALVSPQGDAFLIGIGNQSCGNLIPAVTFDPRDFLALNKLNYRLVPVINRDKVLNTFPIYTPNSEMTKQFLNIAYFVNTINLMGDITNLTAQLLVDYGNYLPAVKQYTSINRMFAVTIHGRFKSN